jgi:hypothetical protein
MHRRARSILALASAVASLLAPVVARAQTVAATQQQYPDRILLAHTSQEMNEGPSTRPLNLNPHGVNYSDCTQDMTLRFTVLVSGFTGQSVQVWATQSGDCSSQTARGIGGVPTCWLVNQGITGLLASSTTTETFDVRVQDLVGPQNAIPNPPVLVRQGASACSSQPSFVAVPMNIWFVPVFGGMVVGTPYNYSIPGGADLVGPPAPTGVSEAAGDTLLTVSWTTNVDSDTAGYDIFIDPIPGHEGTSSDASTFAAPDAQLVCPNPGPVSLASDAAVGDAATDAAQDAATEAGTDAGCYYVNVGGGSGGGSGGACGNSLLASSITQGGATTVTSVDDSGTDATVESGIGGISTIPVGNLFGANSTTGVTVSGKATGTYTITGLKNGTPNCAPGCDYTVVVAAVDTSGNVGPPSVEVCDYPAPVKDFWQTYRQAGGQAGGGFCALGVVGAPVGFSMALAGVGAAFVAAVRRRSRRR